jgi:hypothetical protein
MSFYMVGGIEEVVAKAEKMAKDMAARKADDTKTSAQKAQELADVPSIEKLLSEVRGGACSIWPMYEGEAMHICMQARTLRRLLALRQSVCAR